MRICGTLRPDDHFKMKYADQPGPPRLKFLSEISARKGAPDRIRRAHRRRLNRLPGDVLH